MCISQKQYARLLKG